MALEAVSVPDLSLYYDYGDIVYSLLAFINDLLGIYEYYVEYLYYVLSIQKIVCVYKFHNTDLVTRRDTVDIITTLWNEFSKSGDIDKM